MCHSRDLHAYDEVENDEEGESLAFEDVVWVVSRAEFDERCLNENVKEAVFQRVAEARVDVVSGRPYSSVSLPMHAHTHTHANVHTANEVDRSMGLTPRL